MVQKSEKTLISVVLILLILATVSPCVATNVDIRGAPIDTGLTESGNVSWDYSTFPGFFFAANKNTKFAAGAGEHLYFQDNGGSPAIGSSNPTAHTIDEGELIYTTIQVPSTYKVYSEEENITKVTNFYSLSLFGTTYCAVDNDATNLAKILMQQDASDKKTLKTGETWELKGGYCLVMNAVDVDGSKCYVALYKNGEELDTGIISTDGIANEKIYTVDDECADGSDHIYFLTYVDSVFAGQGDNFAVLKYTWLADKDSYMEVENGDEYGKFEVDEANESGLVLSNSDSISITVDADSMTSLTDDWFFKTSDEGKGTNGGYVIFPVKRVVVEDAASETTAVEETSENVTESDEGTVVVGMSSESEGNNEVSSNEVQSTTNDSTPDEFNVESSVPGFEGITAVLAISMVLLFRRKN